MSAADKAKVWSRYPHACVDSDGNGVWSAWDISHEERQRRDREHSPERHGRGLIGLGRSEAEAWANAVQTIELHEGRRLPLPGEEGMN